jgi:hypothetical protein
MFYYGRRRRGGITLRSNTNFEKGQETMNKRQGTRDKEQETRGKRQGVRNKLQAVGEGE